MISSSGPRRSAIPALCELPLDVLSARIACPAGKFLFCKRFVHNALRFQEIIVNYAKLRPALDWRKLADPCGEKIIFYPALDPVCFKDVLKYADEREGRCAVNGLHFFISSPHLSTSQPQILHTPPPQRA